MKAVICGGGTGGHIYPALAIASKLRDDGCEVLYMGGKDSTEAKLSHKASFDFIGVAATGVSRRSPKALYQLAVNLQGRRQAKKILRDFAPQVVVGTGGYAAAPVVSAAQQLGIPTVIHEQNAFPGRANRLLARSAQAVCLTFAAAGEYFPKRECLHLTGLPVRQAIKTCTRQQAQAFFQLPPGEDVFTLLVTGGSLGASKINNAVSAAYDKLLAHGIRIIHICGENDYFTLRQQAPQHPRLLLMPYLHEMENALALADLALARAGASFLSEAACVGLPLLLVPYPYAANNHQQYNAQAFAQAGAAVVVDNSLLSSTVVEQQVLSLQADAARLAAMSSSSRSLGIDDADEKIAAIVYAMAGK